MLLFILSPFFAALLLLPGYFAARLLTSQATPVDLFWCWACGLGVAAVAMVQFIGFALCGSAPVATACLYLAVVGMLAVAARQAAPGPASRDLLHPLLGYGAFVVFSAGIAALIPTYRTAYMGDWALYYPNAFAYLREVSLDNFREGIRMEYLVRRTPFFSLCCSFFTGFTGLSYAGFQMAATVVNSLLFWVVLSVAQACGGARSRRYALLALPLLPMLMARIAMPTPKPLATMLILGTALAYLHQRSSSGNRQTVLTACLAATAYMAHPMALFYLALPACLWVRDRLRDKQLGASIAIAAAASCVLILPWFAWALGAFGVNRVLVPSYTISETRLPVWQYLVSRITVALTCIVPYPLIDTLRRLGAGTLPAQVRMLSLGTAALRMVYDTIPAGLGLVAATAALRRCLRRGLPPIAADGRRLWCFALVGGGLCLAAHIIPDHKGLAFTVFTPLVILSVPLLAVCLQRAPRVLWLAFGAEALLVRVLVLRLGLLQQPSAPYVTLFHELQPGSRLLILMVSGLALAAYFRLALSPRTTES